jgi:hypothetical protein
MSPYLDGDKYVYASPTGGHVLGGSGSRALQEPLHNQVKAWLREKHDEIRPTGVVTGGCIGFDHIMGQYLAAIDPDISHTVIVPADRSRVHEWWLDPYFSFVEVVEMPLGTTYRDRNIEIVRRSDWLLGQPERPEGDTKSVRSGTWQTIRFARRKGIGVDLAERAWLEKQDPLGRPLQDADQGK